MARTKKTEAPAKKPATKRKPRTSRRKKTKPIEQEEVVVAANTGLYKIVDGEIQPVVTKAEIFDIVPSTEELKTTMAVESELSSGRKVTTPVKTVEEVLKEKEEAPPAKEEPVIVPAAMSHMVEPRTVVVEKKSHPLMWILIVVMGLGLLYSNRESFAPVIEFIDDLIAPQSANGTGKNSATPIVDKEASKLSGQDLTKVRNIKSFYLQADTADGKIVLRTGGNLTWRFHNPGRVNQGDYAKEHGAIGGNGEIAIFPNYDLGKKAVYDLLFNSDSEYSKRTVEQTFVSNKLSYILNKSGVKKDAVLKDLSASDKDKLFAAIQTAEGFTEGKVTVFENEADFKAKGW